MKKRGEIEELEFWAKEYWRDAAQYDGKSLQWENWRIAKHWLWGFMAAARTKRAKDAAYFLAEVAMVRGSLQ
jgi:hypothetical protein